jgi:malate synthase
MGMGAAFLAAYSLKLIQTCHRRGAFAMGGMAAQIPVKGDDAANQAAFAKVKADKEREAGAGHDGTWVAHPDLVPVAMEVFDRLMPTANQRDKTLEDLVITQPQMLELHEGVRTEAGVRENIRVGVRYTQAWLEGRGAVPLYNLMEDAATAEICRTQLWQWVRLGAALDDGREMSSELFISLFSQEMADLRRDFGSPRLEEAAQLFTQMVLSDTLEEFLTLPAYELI